MTNASDDDEPLEHILVINQELDQVDLLLGHVDSMGPCLEGETTAFVKQVSNHRPLSSHRKFGAQS